MNPTHDWHIADGMELMIRRDESDSVGVMLGHEDIDDVHSTLIVTSRLLEMIDTVQPGAVRAYLEQQEPTDAEVRALGRGLNEAGWTCHEGGDNPGFYDECEDCRRVCDDLARAALSAARAARRDEETTR